ncbi:hypothetical protein [Actinomadura bangladeshensis]|uniref:Uncharacterized protein n=1 Tax=Actinomadura bangladeshensis TaxID=453573 RepID=A0A4V2XNG9_9ACTN|nr:hypothetical protein [Actinomadura bangladeshensis]TDC18226.1 hypothetical protein E1284_07105 [Actinomadura bangladeshensis]
MQADRTWVVPQGDPAAVMDAVLRTLAALNWKDVTRQGWTVHARTGSRLAFRLWGAYLAPGRRRFPVRTTVSVASSPSGPAVTMSVAGDEGWYAVRLPIVDRLLAEAATTLHTALENATIHTANDTGY